MTPGFPPGFDARVCIARRRYQLPYNEGTLPPYGGPALAYANAFQAEVRGIVQDLPTVSAAADAIRYGQTRSDAIRCDQVRSDAIRCDRMRACAIRYDPIRYAARAPIGIPEP